MILIVVGLHLGKVGSFSDVISEAVSPEVITDFVFKLMPINRVLDFMINVFPY